ncbi:MAG: MlaD family protein [Smithellaceae bacterium]|jgi:paraquat-inducible protein B|nr:MlaD family protein [Smithellaceae bacterium]MDD3259931.1 MlaD family protein [Smithellaceae bacterium]MDD3848749.1 MlaD family protein [Smithellaceae bacterium]HPL32702.1 MlaD family protein [Smithellaceae bacterium]
MTDPEDLNSLPQSTTVSGRRMRLSVVWIIPILAALVGAGIAVQKILHEGPAITIVFKTAEGIEAGKTFVRYKDVRIGLVQNVKLSKDFTKVVVTAKIDKSAEGLIVEDATFWIELPRVTLSGVSGIGTLLSGNHIGLGAGKSSRPRREFVALDMPPPVSIDKPGRRFMLYADALGSIGIGAPVYYRQINVGQVIGYDLAKDGKSVEIMVFVNAPYDRQITTQTRFWQAGGIDVTLGAAGLSVQMQSMLSLLIGGIAFEQPLTADAEDRPVKEGAVFTLYGNRTAAESRHEEIITPYVLYFKESVRGLSVGAPVTVAGLTIGEVTDVSFEYDPAKVDVRSRVDIVMYPSRLTEYMKPTPGSELKPLDAQGRRAFIQRMVNRGYRAQLRVGNLVMGQLYIAIDRFPNAPKAKPIDWRKPPYELPVMSSSMEDLETRVSNIIAKIDRIPLEAIGTDVRDTLETLNRTLKDADRVMNRIDRDTVPAVQATLEDLRKAIAKADRVLAGADQTLVGKDSPTQQELREALQEVSRAARSISDLVDYLERNPQSLIRGKEQEVPR